MGHVDEFILYSGGAPGADSLFGENAERYGLSEQHYSFRGHADCRSRGRVILADDQLQQGNAVLLAVVGYAFKRRLGSGSQVEKCWQRDWHQVQRASQVFVVTNNIGSLFDFTQEQERIEGAGIPGAIAIKTKPGCQKVCVYDQVLGKWYVWTRSATGSGAGLEVEYKKIDADTFQAEAERWPFEEMDDEDVEITADFAGIGVRNLNPKGVEAINRLFERSFGLGKQKKGENL